MLSKEWTVDEISQSVSWNWHAHTRTHTLLSFFPCPHLYPRRPLSPTQGHTYFHQPRCSPCLLCFSSIWSFPSGTLYSLFLLPGTSVQQLSGWLTFINSSSMYLFKSEARPIIFNIAATTLKTRTPLFSPGHMIYIWCLGLIPGMKIPCQGIFILFNIDFKCLE